MEKSLLETKLLEIVKVLYLNIFIGCTTNVFTPLINKCLFYAVPNIVSGKFTPPFHDLLIFAMIIGYSYQLKSIIMVK